MLMLNIRTILHGTDFSSRADCAFRLAFSLAKDYRARLVVLHVVSLSVVIEGVAAIASRSEEFLAEAREKLDKLPAADAEVRFERRLAEGSPSEEILRIAQEINADLIVLGTHGRSGLARAFMGSVAEDVLRKASCPVLTITVPSQTEPVEKHASFHEGEVCRT
jgi:nucleotide-binding universal stress UspA family protein